MIESNNLEICRLPPSFVQKRNSRKISNKLNVFKYQDLNVSTISDQLLDVIKNSSFMTKLDQLKIITKALTLSELQSYLLKKLLLDEPNVIKVYTILAPLCTYASFKANQPLFSIGDKVKKAYILINGTIKLTKPEMINKTIPPYEYYTIINGYIEDGHNYLFGKTIEANQSIYPIDKEDVNELNLILFKKVITSLDIDNANDFEEYAEKLMLQFKVTRNQLDLSSNDLITQSIIAIKLAHISMNKINKNAYLIDNKIKREIKICVYHDYIINTPGSLIAKNDINSDNIYKEKAVSVTQSELMAIPYELYSTNILSERKKVVDREVSFFIKHFFFQSIYKKKFAKSYLDLFTYKVYKKDEIVIHENSKSEEILFIKQGMIKLSMNKSIIEVQALIHYIECMVRSESKDDDYPNIVSNPKDNCDQYKSRRMINLYDIDEKEMLLSEFCFYGINSIYTAKVISQNAIVYRLSLIDLIKIIQEEPKVYKAFEYNSVYKMKMLKMRMIKFNSLIISKIDYQYSSDLDNNDAINNDNNNDIVYCNDSYLNKNDILNYPSLCPIKRSVIKNKIDIAKITNKITMKKICELNPNLKSKSLFKLKKNHSLHYKENNLIKRLTRELNIKEIESLSYIKPSEKVETILPKNITKKRSSSLFSRNFLMKNRQNNKKSNIDNNNYHILHYIKHPKKSFFSLNNNNNTHRVKYIFPKLQTSSTHYDTDRDNTQNNSHRDYSSFDSQITNLKQITSQRFTNQSIIYPLRNRHIYDYKSFTALHKMNIDYKKTITNRLNQS